MGADGKLRTLVEGEIENMAGVRGRFSVREGAAGTADPSVQAFPT